MNYSRLSINHIVKIFCLLCLINSAALAQVDTIPSSENIDSIYVMTKSPLAAVLFSAVVPGAGQIYNESYWKAPLIWGVGAWLVYNWVDLNNNYKLNNRLYQSTGSALYRDRRTQYRDERDLFTIYMVLTYVLNLIDAYVDAHLFDFSVEEDFLIRQPRLAFRYYLP